MKRTVEVEVGVEYADLPSLLMEAAALIEQNPLKAGIEAQAAKLKEAWAEIETLKAELDAHVCTVEMSGHVCDHSKCVSVADYQELWSKYNEATTGTPRTNNHNRRRGSNQTWSIGSLIQIAPHDEYTSYTGGRVVGYRGRGSSHVVVRPNNHGRDEVIERRYISAAKPASGTVQE